MRHYQSITKEKLITSSDIRNNKTEYLVAIIFFLPLINYFLAEILISFNINSLSTYFYIIVYLTALYSYFYVLKKNPMQSVLFSFIAVATFLVTYLFNNQTIVYMINDSIVKSNLFFFWGLYFPLFLLGTCPISFEKLLKIAYKFSVITIIFNIVAFIIKISGISSGVFNYMAFAYSALIPIFITFYYSVKTKQIFILALSIISSAIIVVGGSRGALITMAIFYLLYLVFLVKGRSIKGFLVKVLVLIGTIFLAFNLSEILELIDRSLTSLGYSSRLFSIINNSSFLESSGRDKIWMELMDGVNLVGHGLYGDRIIANDFYAHNWMLEFIINFGVVGGIYAICIVVYVIFGAYLKAIFSNDSDLKFILICVISIFFVKHMLSASYLTSAEFWLFLGLTFNLYNTRLEKNTDMRGCEKIGDW